MLKNYIIITTINAPSAAILGFRTWPGWHIVVVGDRKTPANWACEGVTFLSLAEQYRMFGDFSHAIPENTYTRKMLGYAYAIQQGATAIFESDDDNLPYTHAAACIEAYLADSKRTSGERRAGSSGWLNVYRLFGAPECWPRGFPIERIKDPLPEESQSQNFNPWSLVQFLADEDPDVDAIYRLVSGKSVFFAREKRFILDAGTFSPVNSQATLWTQEMFPFLFLPLGVSDRVTDILRGYIATAGIWAMGYSVAYASPIVYQRRNEHNLLRDFQQEIPLYENAEAWCAKLRSIKARSASAFYTQALHLLERENTFACNNLPAYTAFLDCCSLT